jgi:predicted aminopeptidase
MLCTGKFFEVCQLLRKMVTYVFNIGSSVRCVRYRNYYDTDKAADAHFWRRPRI